MFSYSPCLKHFPGNTFDFQTPPQQDILDHLDYHVMLPWHNSNIPYHSEINKDKVEDKQIYVFCSLIQPILTFPKTSPGSYVSALQVF